MERDRREDEGDGLGQGHAVNRLEYIIVNFSGRRWEVRGKMSTTSCEGIIGNVLSTTALTCIHELVSDEARRTSNIVDECGECLGRSPAMKSQRDESVSPVNMNARVRINSLLVRRGRLVFWQGYRFQTPQLA